MMMGIGMKMRRRGGVRATLASLLAKYGTNAHAWLPGANGVSVASLPSNNYLLSDGSTGYSTVDGVDGLTLDGMGSLGSELVTNGDFSSGTGWTGLNGTVAIAGGVLSGTTSGASNVFARTNINVTAGRTYLLSIEVVAAAQNVSVYWNNPGFTAQLAFASTLGLRSMYIVAADTGVCDVAIVGSGASATATIDNISVREITGIHASQATNNNKPILRRGLVNLLTYSNDLSNATSWPKGNATAPASASLAPDGTTCFELTDNATSADHKMRQDVTVAAGTVVTFAAVAKAGTAGYAWLYDGYANSGKNFNLSSQAGLTAIGTAPTAFSTADMGNGWAMYTITYTTSTSTRPEIGMSLNGSTINYVGSGSTILVDAAGLFTGSLTASQILAQGGIPVTTTAAASNPNAGSYSWSFDGSNDSFLTGNLGITDTVTVVIAGVLNTLPAVSLLVCEDANGVRFGVSSTGAVSFDKNGVDALVATAAGVIVAGVPFVLTARLQAGNADIRKAGAQIATAASALTFSATAGMRIGTKFDGVTYPCNGSIFAVQVITATTTDADCLAIERLVAQQAGITI